MRVQVRPTCCQRLSVFPVCELAGMVGLRWATTRHLCASGVCGRLHAPAARGG
jgi:hypothetical protein